MNLRPSGYEPDGNALKPPETGHQISLVLSWCYDEFTFYFGAMGGAMTEVYEI